MTLSTSSFSTSPSEDESNTRELLIANSLDVFDECNVSLRRTKALETYTEDVTWFERIAVQRRRDTLNYQAGELQREAPGFSFKAKGEMAICQNMGTLKWWFGPADNPSLFNALVSLLSKVVGLSFCRRRLIRALLLWYSMVVLIKHSLDGNVRARSWKTCLPFKIVSYSKWKTPIVIEGVTYEYCTC